MNKKPSWEDIPSLKLRLDDDIPEKDAERRRAVRLVSGDIISMLMSTAKNIQVQVVSHNHALKKKGILQDINQGGMCLYIGDHNLQKNVPIQIGMMLGEREFKTHADVRWVAHDKVGIKYVSPNRDDIKFLSGLYASKALRHI
jgi:hypothetical protein